MGFGGTSTASKLDSLMDGFHSEETALGMSLKDFSKSAVVLLMINYEVDNEQILRTTALAM